MQLFKNPSMLSIPTSKNASKLLWLYLVGFGVLAPAPALADFIGIYMGAGSWGQKFEGNLDDAVFDTNVNLSNDDGSIIYVAIEHPIPILPNFKLQRTSMSTTGSVTSQFSYNGQIAEVGSDVDLSFDQLDSVAYMELLDNWVALDLGVAIRFYDIEFVVDNPFAAADAKDDLSVAIPFLYGAAAIKLPLGLYFNAEAFVVSYNGSSIEDIKYGIGYESKFRLGVEAGVRSTTIDMDEVDKFSSKFTAEGSYVSVTLHI